jgi:nuclear pore complex protein Nup62
MWVCMYGSTCICMYVGMYVCGYVCMWVCMYGSTCICMYVGMYVCGYVCMCVCMYVCIYCICMHVCMYACMCVCVCMYVCIVYVSMYVCMSAYTYTYTYTYIHIYMSTGGDNRRQYLYFCTSKASKLSTYLFGSGEIGLAEFTSMFNDLITSTKEEMEGMAQVLHIFKKKWKKRSMCYRFFL